MILPVIRILKVISCIAGLVTGAQYPMLIRAKDVLLLAV